MSSCLHTHTFFFLIFGIFTLAMAFPGLGGGARDSCVPCLPVHICAAPRSNISTFLFFLLVSRTSVPASSLLEGEQQQHTISRSFFFLIHFHKFFGRCLEEAWMGVDEREYSAVSSPGGDFSFFFFRNSTALDMRGIISFRYWYRQTDKTR